MPLLQLLMGLDTHFSQVAYLMADISDVSGSVIKEIYQSLESLSCKAFLLVPVAMRS